MCVRIILRCVCDRKEQLNFRNSAPLCFLGVCVRQRERKSVIFRCRLRDSTHTNTHFPTVALLRFCSPQARPAKEK